LKKVSYNLNFGLINLSESNIESKNKIFIEYLNKKAIKSNYTDEEDLEKTRFEFMIVFEDIPIKIKIFFAQNFDDLIYRYDEIENLDVIILIFNYNNLESIESLNPNDFTEFKKFYTFQGSSILVGIDLENEKNNSEHEQIRSKLIEKTKQLEILYAYEISDQNKDISGLFEKLFQDFIFKFQYTSPELFDLAKLYGKEIIEK
jgi:hypothetical protein